MVVAVGSEIPIGLLFAVVREQQDLSLQLGRGSWWALDQVCPARPLDAVDIADQPFFSLCPAGVFRLALAPGANLGSVVVPEAAVLVRLADLALEAALPVRHEARV
jgi:hypothetical protein